MNRRIAMLVILSAGLLAACETSGPDRVEATNPTVRYEFDGDEELQTATERADDYCDSFGMDAQLQDIDENDDGDDVAVFGCL